MPPPKLNADSSENEVGQGIDISFIDDPAWRAAINDVKVNEQSLRASIPWLRELSVSMPVCSLRLVIII